MTIVRIRFVCLILLVFCSGCTHRQVVTTSYSFWGKAVSLNVPGSDTQRSLQLLSPRTTDQIKGCLLIVHGMNEHIGRYGDIARHFADHFIVAGIDLTAHGMSNPLLAQAHQNIVNGIPESNVSDAFLEQAQFDDLQPMRDDLKLALNYLSAHCNKSSDHTHLPIFIVSHSLGSLVASSYLLKTKQDQLTSKIKGIIFSGPAFSVTEVPGWRGWFQNPFIRFSFYTHEHFLNPQGESIPIMLFNQFIALISVPLHDAVIELISLPGLRQLFSPTTPAWVKDYLTDSEQEKMLYCNDKYIIRRSIMRYILAIEREVIEFKHNMDHFDHPYLLVYSENDPITPAWGSQDFAAATFNNNAHNRVMMLAGKQHHEQLFSAMPLRKQILDVIDYWLQGQLNNLDREE